MATALFIKRQDLVRNTILDGNVDTDKFIQFIKIAQEIHIRNYTGTDLYNKISDDIIAGTLSGNYLTLVNTVNSLRYGRLFAICSVSGKKQWSI